MDYEILKTVAGILGTVGLPPIATMIIYAIKEMKKIKADNKAREIRQDKALQIIIRFSLDRTFKEASDRGTITDEDLRKWEEAYQIYHGLGENGIMDSKRERMFQLPIVDQY